MTCMQASERNDARFHGERQSRGLVLFEDMEFPTPKERVLKVGARSICARTSMLVFAPEEKEP